MLPAQEQAQTLRQTFLIEVNSAEACFVNVILTLSDWPSSTFLPQYPFCRGQPPFPPTSPGPEKNLQ